MVILEGGRQGKTLRLPTRKEATLNERIRPAWRQAPSWMTEEQKTMFYMGVARYLALTETAKAARRQIRDYSDTAQEQNDQDLELEAPDDLGTIPGDSSERGSGQLGDS